MEDGKVKITKLGSSTEPPKNYVIPKVTNPELEGGKKRKSIKTFPKGILKTAKIKGVKDPAKHPPLKKIMRKHTIRLLTDSGVSQRRKTIKQKVDKMKDEKVKELVVKHGLSKGKAPPKILREILEGGMLAGFISST
jgi:hypothetical protein